MGLALAMQGLVKNTETQTHMAAEVPKYFFVLAFGFLSLIELCDPYCLDLGLC